MQSETNQKMDRKRLVGSKPNLCALVMASCVAIGPTLRADMVTDWNAYTEQATITAVQGPPVVGRSFAIVHAAIYDAVNGIQRQYKPYFVTERGPRDASAEAAAAQAAYTALVGLYPAQKPTFDAELVVSLASIPPGHDDRHIERGLAWGEYVANQILAWRSTDGSTASLTPYFGGGAPGVWRSPPAGTSADGTLPGLFPQYAVLVPFAMTSHDQFRPGPPPALTSALYAADVNEVEAIAL